MAPLREVEREQAQSQRAEMQSWRNQHALWKGKRDQILNDAKSAKTGEKATEARADLEALGPEPAAPPAADRVVSEPTFEGLTRLFAEGQPSLGIFSDEGGQFLGGYAMNSDNRQKTSTALNDLWQGNPIRRTRQGDGSFTLYGRRLAMHLMVQPGVARDFMSDAGAVDTGFLARFLICEPLSTIGTRLNSAARRDDTALEHCRGRLRTILNTAMPMDQETRELKPRTLPLAPEARALLADFADEVEVAQSPGGAFAHLTAHASKAAEQAARIAGVLTLWRDLYASEVTVQEMANAIALARFYLSEAARLADAATISADVDKAERLRRWLLEDWPHAEIVPGDVQQRAPTKGLRERPATKKAIAILEEAGWLIRLDPDTVVRGSKRKEAYRIVRESGEYK